MDRRPNRKPMPSKRFKEHESNNLFDTLLHKYFNDFVDEEARMENHVFQMAELDDMFYGVDATSIFDAALDGQNYSNTYDKFTTNDDYFAEEPTYGYLISIAEDDVLDFMKDSLDNIGVYKDEFIDWCRKHDYQRVFTEKSARRPIRRR